MVLDARRCRCPRRSWRPRCCGLVAEILVGVRHIIVRINGVGIVVLIVVWDMDGLLGVEIVTVSRLCVVVEHVVEDAARREVGNLIVLDTFPPRSILMRGMGQPILVSPPLRPIKFGCGPNS
uniref:Uncharacterized protein n=1 Tax=Hemiselmis tepida TaxID=464990 RepID=A0A7S0YWP3_9CRYP